MLALHAAPLDLVRDEVRRDQLAEVAQVDRTGRAYAGGDTMVSPRLRSCASAMTSSARRVTQSSAGDLFSHGFPSVAEAFRMPVCSGDAKTRQPAMAGLVVGDPPRWSRRGPGPTPIAEIGAPASPRGLHVGLRVLRQVVEGAASVMSSDQPGELLVDRLRVVEVGLVERELVEALAVDLVRDADRDLLPAGQHVELGQDEVGDAVDPGRVARDRGVEPAAAAGTAGRRAVLAAGLAQGLAVVVEQLGRERAVADAGRVRLEDADDPVDVRRRRRRSRCRRRPRSGSTR